MGIRQVQVVRRTVQSYAQRIRFQRQLYAVYTVCFLTELRTKDQISETTVRSLYCLFPYRVTHKGSDFRDNCTQFILFVSLQSYAQRIRFQRRLYAVYTNCFLTFMIICNYKLYFCFAKSLNNQLEQRQDGVSCTWRWSGGSTLGPLTDFTFLMNPYLMQKA